MNKPLTVNVLQAGSQLIADSVRVLRADGRRFRRTARRVRTRGQQELLQVTLGTESAGGYGGGSESTGWL